MSDGNIETRKLVTRLVIAVVAMFAFGFALVPLYDVMCKALGINGKTSGTAYQGDGQVVDQSREVKIQFVANNNIDMVWEFHPEAEQLVVHPGAVNQMLFVAYNPTDKPMTAQAIPSIAPSVAATYFHKTECFCFTQQVLQPGERIEMPVRFIVDRDLPKDVRHLTLAYTENRRIKPEYAPSRINKNKQKSKNPHDPRKKKAELAINRVKKNKI